MSELLRNIENILLFSLWCISAFLITASVLTAVWLSVRRVMRNRRDMAIQTRQKQFESYLQELITAETFPSDFHLPAHIRKDTTAVTASLLKFFKIVRGKEAVKLRIIVDELGLEKIVTRATTRGNRGKRMRAYNVLSFLDSSTSLKTISENLYSDDKYIRLSVARCIARRKVMSLISEVTEAVNFAFPDDESLLTDVLYRFGDKAIPRLERMITRSENNTIIAGAVETLILLKPENTSVDFACLYENEDERVRAAAVLLSVISRGEKHVDLLPLGLRDHSRKVKIRSLKCAAREQRSDTFGEIYRSMQDPFLWIRYWAMRAAMNSGPSGQTLMRSVSRRTDMPGDLAKEVILEG